MMDYKTSIVFLTLIILLGIIAIIGLFFVGTKITFYAAIALCVGLVLFIVLWMIYVVESAKREADSHKQPFMNIACHN